MLPCPEINFRFLLFPVAEFKLIFPTPVPVDKVTVLASKFRFPPIVRLLFVVVIFEFEYQRSIYKMRMQLPLSLLFPLFVDLCETGLAGLDLI